MERFFLLSCLALALTLSACGGGGGGGESEGDGASTGTPAPATASTVVLAANDLGMHCIDKEYSVFSILPPFNVVNAQVIGHSGDGKPVLLDQSRVDVRYSATTDVRGSINSYSRAKTDFWSHANSLFGANLADGQGLTGLYGAHGAVRGTQDGVAAIAERDDPKLDWQL